MTEKMQIMFFSVYFMRTHQNYGIILSFNRTHKAIFVIASGDETNSIEQYHKPLIFAIKRIEIASL